jgi:hypothetical protein
MVQIADEPDISRVSIKYFVGILLLKITLIFYSELSDFTKIGTFSISVAL